MSNLSKFIKAKRKKIGLTQVELAERAGVGLRFGLSVILSKVKSHYKWIK